MAAARDRLNVESSLPSSGAILLVEDSPSQAAVYSAYLGDAPHDLLVVSSGEEALMSVSEGRIPDLILLDLGLPGMNGMDLLRRFQEDRLEIPIIIITDNESAHVAAEAMRLGAVDYLAKPFGRSRLQITVQNALERHRLQALVRSYRRSLDTGQFHGMVGQSPGMQGIFETIRSVGPTDAAVFITGESGTGKELCARAVHAESPRREKPFVPLNCAAIPKHLMESEIFGHEKGAFTGATRSRNGAATLADGGSLFLDEICDMDLELQAKLLRFIQAGTFQPVGGEPRHANIRFIAATNKDPEHEIAAGRFREDLYYRLHVVPLQLPPLRLRHDDALSIARQILEQTSVEYNKRFRSFNERAEALFSTYAWPGNVRELENVIRNIVALNSGEVVTADMLPAKMGQRAADDPGDHNSCFNRERVGLQQRDIEPLAVVERKHIEKAIAACKGSIARAAGLLGVNPSTLYRKRSAWGSQG